MTEITIAKAPRIWVLHCPFKKNGYPSLGTFGKTIEEVIVMKASTWTQLCVEIPALGDKKFEVGS